MPAPSLARGMPSGAFPSDAAKDAVSSPQPDVAERSILRSGGLWLLPAPHPGDDTECRERPRSWRRRRRPARAPAPMEVAAVAVGRCIPRVAAAGIFDDRPRTDRVHQD